MTDEWPPTIEIAGEPTIECIFAGGPRSDQVWLRTDTPDVITEPDDDGEHAHIYERATIDGDRYVYRYLGRCPIAWVQ